MTTVNLTSEARCVLAIMNSRGHLLTSEILRDARRPGSPLATYFTPGCSRDTVANQLISAFMRTRFRETRGTP